MAFVQLVTAGLPVQTLLGSCIYSQCNRAHNTCLLSNRTKSESAAIVQRVALPVGPGSRGTIKEAAWRPALPAGTWVKAGPPAPV